jgi:hypothetical protein
VGNSATVEIFDELVIADTETYESVAVPFGGAERGTIQIAATKTATPGNLVLTLYSSEDGTNWNALSAHTFSATGVVNLYVNSAHKWLKLTAICAEMTLGDAWELEADLTMLHYAGKPVLAPIRPNVIEVVEGQSINDAVQAASAGDLVLGYPGASRTYTEKAGVKILFLEDVADMVMAYDADINALRVSQVTKISGEDTNNDRITTMPKYAYTNIIGAVADTEVKAGPGVVAKIVVNTAGAAGSTITLYDGPVATGTVIAIIDGTALGTYSYDVSCETSIHVATVDGAGTLNITVLSV